MNKTAKNSNEIPVVDELAQLELKLQSEIEKNDVLNATITANENEIKNLNDSNLKLADSLDAANKRIEELLNRKAFRESLNTSNNEDISEIVTEGMTVTPTEKVKHLEVGYNCEVVSVNKNKKTMVVKNKDNYSAHREETTVNISIFRIVAMFIFLLLSFSGFSQSDSTNVSMSGEVSTLLGAIFSLLSYLGISIPIPTVITAIILFIVRAVERYNMKKKTVEEIKSVINIDAADNTTPNLTETHKGLLYRLIDKIEKRKKK